MAFEIKIPSVGESITEAILAEWYKKEGDTVGKDDLLLVIETDKVTLEVAAEVAGVLHILVSEGETVAIGQTVGTLDTESVSKAPSDAVPPVPSSQESSSAPAEKVVQGSPIAPTPSPQVQRPAAEKTDAPIRRQDNELPPSVRRLVAQKSIDVNAILGSGPNGRVTKGDVLLFLEQEVDILEKLPSTTSANAPTQIGGERREPMSPIRKRISERLLAAKQNTAMLTTFNEIDMSRVMAIRSRHKDEFEKRHGVKLGFMSFFLKAAIEALKRYPEINAYIDGTDLLYHDYCHIGVAISGDRGLVVPVIRHAEAMGLAQLEQAIIDFVTKIKNNKLSLTDLEGGTFTITNGGIFGNLLSTPILNMPQSGILGMHKIQKRPVVVDDEIVIRPMMYIALSYDHRIVDGKGAVSFLKQIKTSVENPERILMEI